MKNSIVRSVAGLALITAGVVLLYLGGRLLFFLGLALLAFAGLLSSRGWSWLACALVFSFLAWLYLSGNYEPSLIALGALWLTWLLVEVGSWQAKRNMSHDANAGLEQTTKSVKVTGEK